MNQLPIVRQKRYITPFRLTNEPIMFALSYHFNNMFAYFHPNNEEARIYQDKGICAYTGHIISVLQWLVHNEAYIETYVEMRTAAPIEFRCSQMIQHYGSQAIREWIELFYGKVL